MTQEELIEELKQRIENLCRAAKEYAKMDLDVLNRRPDEGKWSVLECFEHMNLYGEIYIIHIGDAIEKAKPVSGEKVFKSGVLGNYSAKSMLPKDSRIKNKMKTFKKMDPIGSSLDKTVFNEFIEQQGEFLELLEKSLTVDISKVKVRLTIPVLKFRLGDTFRFVINHNIRHLIQAKSTLESVNG